jgi:hypothetical protein
MRQDTLCPENTTVKCAFTSDMDLREFSEETQREYLLKCEYTISLDVSTSLPSTRMQPQPHCRS